MNILMCSVGRRGELIKDFKKSLDSESKIVATDCSCYAPALYLADKQYIVPRIDDSNYLNVLLDICAKESINAITTFIDPEIELLAENREKFEALGVEVLAPYKETAELCFDKYKMYLRLKDVGIKTPLTFDTFNEFYVAWADKKIQFPVFVKPRTGSGSVGARKAFTIEQLKEAKTQEPELIIQEYMNCEDLDADVYIDTITHEAVSIFTKKKIETKIGGASKTISFKDNKLFELIETIVRHFKFNGPIDMDFFHRDGEYYLSEINPRFGGAYLHAYGAGVDFIKLIKNNIENKPNEKEIGNYDDGVVMMMFDSVVIKKKDELVKTV
jgi:carbamoyl-phosphate synthase large subunit